jgi:endonuclease/exonuclease/phosphatase family metal-dependent hydrolase
VRLVVTTWNLQGSRGVDVDEVAAYLREVDSDIVALQEVQRRQAHALARRLGVKSLHWGFKHWPLVYRAEGMALIGVSQEILQPRSLAVTRPLRVWSSRRRIVQFGGLPGADGPLSIANVHLTARGHAGATDRKRELNVVLGQPRTPAISVGDFNAQPTGDLFEPMRAVGLMSVGGGATYWRGQPSNRPPDHQLDYVWVNSEIGVAGVSLPRHGEPGFDRFPPLSDHLPLTAMLEIHGWRPRA